MQQTVQVRDFTVAYQRARQGAVVLLLHGIHNWRVIGLLVAAVISVSSAPAQGSRHLVRIGILEFSSADLRQTADAALLESLRSHGYVEGKNLLLERRYADGRPERVGDLAKELAAMRLDAIVSTCTPTTLSVSRETQSTPIVMARVADPVSSGLVSSLANPGKNVTGLSSQFENVVGKMLELLLDGVPKATPIGIIFNPANSLHRTLMADLAAGARERGASVVPIEMGLKVDVADGFEAIRRQRVASLLVLPDDPVLLHRRGPIAEHALRHRLPSVFGVREAVEEGGLMSYGASTKATYRQVAYYLDRIAKGAAPGTLPVQQPSTFEFVINAKTARALGLTLPPSLLLRADQVIQ